jgi:hypothetical protein
MLPPIYLADINKCVTGNIEKIDHLKTPPIDVDNAQEIKDILTQHGCTIEEHADFYNIIFPPDTTRWRGLIAGISQRYSILLPDGYVIYEKQDLMRELSFLSLPKEV